MLEEQSKLWKQISLICISKQKKKHTGRRAAYRAAISANGRAATGGGIGDGGGNGEAGGPI